MKIKNLFCAGMAGVMLTSAAVPASAATREAPQEYKHTTDEMVDNDKSYMRGFFVDDTSLWQAMRTIPIPELESYYGYDDDGNIYVKEREPRETYPYDPPLPPLHDPCDDLGPGVNVYLIEDGVKKKAGSYIIDFDEADYWVRDLKPYTTYTVQSEVYYELGTIKDENGNDKYVVKSLWSDPVKLRTCPKKTAITYSKAGKHTIRLKWKPVKCEGYKLQQYNAKKKKWATVKTLPKSKTAAKLTGLKKNTKYKYRVVPYGRVADKRYPRTIAKEIKKDKELPYYEFYYSTALFAKPSKVVTVKTKK